MVFPDEAHSYGVYPKAWKWRPNTSKMRLSGKATYVVLRKQIPTATLGTVPVAIIIQF